MIDIYPDHAHEKKSELHKNSCLAPIHNCRDSSSVPRYDYSASQISRHGDHGHGRKQSLETIHNPHFPPLVIHGPQHRSITKHEGADSGRVPGSGNSYSGEMAIEPPYHQGERAQRRNQGIIGGLHGEGDVCGTETSEQMTNCCRST